jgi:hypothetical protein
MKQTELQKFMGDINWLFNPEPDDDDDMLREFPNKRIRDYHGLDMSYMESYDWEGSSYHKHTLLCPSDEQSIHALTRNKDVPYRLFGTALRLYADSIIKYHDKKEKKGELRFYPPVILTFWAGFETFVRYSSELLIATAESIPIEIINFLSEKERYVDKKGEILIRTKYQGVLDRYTVFLKYAYNFKVNKGDSYWQELVKAKQLRDYYTHLDISEPRCINSQEVLGFMESILLAIIVPSSKLQRTLMRNVYWLYDIWTTLNEYHVVFEERPLLINWPLKEEYLFHCNFENVDSKRFKSERKRLEEKVANKNIMDASN